ncbi:MAG: DUF3368 domain-containing protein [Armatimonadetes bacterium]|nr:DUF3368 domain-containing protein [Armatimonadota bacterium]
MANLRCYVDATALIGLARIGRLDLLALLPTPVYVTEWVWAEVTGDPTKPGVTALEHARGEELLLVVDEGDPQAFPPLDPGESTVLSAAAATHAAVLIDERRARALVRTHPALRVAIRERAGVVGLVLFAKTRGHVSTARPLLDDLIRQGFRISRALYEDALRKAGER